MQKRVYLIDALFFNMKRLISILFVLFTALSSFSQNKGNDNQLALLYYSQGEYEKAADIYYELFSQTHSQIHFDYLIACYNELHNYEKAEKITNEQIKRFPKSFYYPIKLATIYNQTGKTKDADDIFEKTIKKAGKQLETSLEAGQACIDNKVENVAKTIYENALSKYPDNRLIVKNLAELYLHSGENDKLAQAYISLLSNNSNELEFIENQLQYSLYEHSNNKLKQTLIKYIEPLAEKERKEFTFKPLLLWIMMQDQNYEKAFALSKEIDEANDSDGEKVFELGKIALSNNEFEYAATCFSYITKIGRMGDYYEVALKNLLETSYNKLFKANSQVDNAQIVNLEKEYLKALDEIGDAKTIAEIIKNLAHIQAFYLNKQDEAIQLLNENIAKPNIRIYKSQLEMELAAIYLFTNDIWAANLQYASVALNYKNNDIGHEAQLKQAKIAYYNGNFEYAKALLDVLKGSTSKLIANDAFELAQLISDNTALDTTTTALEIFARGDLYLNQGKYTEAIVCYDSIPKWFPGHSLEDEILMRKATIATLEHNDELMLKYLQEIEDRFSYEIYADKAIFTLAEYYDKTENFEKAKEKYKRIIFEYPNSIYSSSARSRYRELDSKSVNP